MRLATSASRHDSFCHRSMAKLRCKCEDAGRLLFSPVPLVNSCWGGQQSKEWKVKWNEGLSCCCTQCCDMQLFVDQVQLKFVLKDHCFYTIYTGSVFLFLCEINPHAISRTIHTHSSQIFPCVERPSLLRPQVGSVAGSTEYEFPVSWKLKNKILYLIL